MLLTFISSLAGLVLPGTQGRSVEGKETIKESSIVVKNADSGLKNLGSNPSFFNAPRCEASDNLLKLSGPQAPCP